MKQYEECKKFDAFVKGKKIMSIKWWADCNELSPTLIFADGTSVDIICKSLRFDFHNHTGKKRTKPERMDSLVKGAELGKPKEVKENQLKERSG